MSEDRTVTVSGQGTTSDKPDFAQANLSVNAVSPNLAEAGQKADGLMNQSVAALKD